MKLIKNRIVDLSRVLLVGAVALTVGLVVVGCGENPEQPFKETKLSGKAKDTKKLSQAAEMVRID